MKRSLLCDPTRSDPTRSDPTRSDPTRSDPTRLATQPLSPVFTLPDLESAIDRNCLIVSPQTRLIEAIQDLGLRQTNLTEAAAAVPSCILVVAADRLVGLFTAQDIPRVIAAGVNLEAAPIEQCMVRSPPNLRLSESSSLLSALEIIQEYAIQYLPVLEPDGRVAGVITADTLYRRLTLLDSPQLLDHRISRQPTQPTKPQQTPIPLLDCPGLDCPRDNRPIVQGNAVKPHSTDLEFGLTRSADDLLNSAIASIVRLRLFDDRTWEYDFWSVGCEAVFGYTAQELIQDRQLWFSRIPQADLDAVIEPSWERMYSERTFRNEYRFRHKDGSLRWISGVIKSQRHEAANCWVVTVVDTDISDRKRIEAALWESEARLLHLISTSPAVIYTCEATGDYNLTYISNNITDYLGFKPEDFLSQPQLWQTRLHPEDLSILLEVRSALFQQGFQISEYRLRHQDGSYRWVNDQIRLLRDQAGNPKEMIGCILDITDRKQAEEKLKASLQEKEILLQEIHHRVKNNLQIISSLLYLQAHAIEDQRACSALQESRNRVESMALVHESLYQTRDFNQIDFVGYVRRLAKHLLNSYLPEPKAISFRAEIHPDVKLSLKQALPCGLIINELVSNALKHRFRDQATGHIGVLLEPRADHWLSLVVSHSGDSFPADFNLQQPQSMGLELVKALCRQLKGALELERGEGTTFKICFPQHSWERNSRSEKSSH